MSLKLTVKVVGSLYNKDGKLTQRIVTHNLITNSGYTALLNNFGGNTPTVFNKIAVGNGATPPSLQDVSLVAETARTNATFKKERALSSGTLVANFIAGEATGEITEAGIVASDGTLFDRVTFAPIKKGALDTLELTFTLNFKEV